MQETSLEDTGRTCHYDGKGRGHILWRFTS